MRKLLMTLFMLGGVALAGAAPASANAASGLAVKPNAGIGAPSQVEDVRWRGRHRGYRRGFGFGFGHPGIYGFYGYPGYGYHRRHYRRHYYGGYGGYRHHRRWRDYY